MTKNKDGSQEDKKSRVGRRTERGIYMGEARDGGEVYAAPPEMTEAEQKEVRRMFNDAKGEKLPAPVAKTLQEEIKNRSKVKGPGYWQ
jgi:hypothetical protein